MHRELTSILLSRIIGTLSKHRSCAACSRARYSTASKKNHYDALGITPHATHNEVKSAYYKLSLQYHPDKDSSAGAKERFQEISSAYEVLSNHETRKQYDVRMKVMYGRKSNVSRQAGSTDDSYETMRRGKIFDFDEWARQHYQETIEYQMKVARQYKQYQEGIQLTNEKMDTTSIIFYVIFIAMFSVISYYNIYQPPLPRKVTNDEDISSKQSL